MNPSGDDKRAPASAEAVVSERTITVPHSAYSIAGTLTAAFGNVLQPLLPIVWLSVVGFGGLLGACFFLKRAGKPVMKGLFGFAIMGTLVSLFLLGAQFAQGSENSRKLAQETGVVAATVPGLVAVQNAVLPISATEKQTNSFRRAIEQGDEDDRGAAARAGIDEAGDVNTRTALLGIALKSGAQSVRQAGLARAVADRAGAPLPIRMLEQPAPNAAAAILQGAQFALTIFDADTGAGSGWISCGGRNYAVNAVAAGGAITMTGRCYDYGTGKWRQFQINVSPDKSLQLAGEAQIGDERVKIEIPLL
jgi:hypothetical protein